MSRCLFYSLLKQSDPMKSKFSCVLFGLEAVHLILHYSRRQGYLASVFKSSETFRFKVSFLLYFTDYVGSMIRIQA
jgi:hypothetical protein